MTKFAALDVIQSHHGSPLRQMIVCSCNVLSDKDVRATLSGPDTPRTACEVYQCLGCSAQCGRCARTIRRIMDDALAGAAPACCRAPKKRA